MTLQAPRIDHTYRKDTTLPVGQGYSVRPRGIKPSSLIIHTTNNARPTLFRVEASYLQLSRKVSAHFLVGKAGEIAQFLSPELMAWHAGAAVEAWVNEVSIGIESHVSIGEQWTGAQRQALTWLVKWLMVLYGIPPVMVETHRRVALPPGRKSDPEGWTDEAFYSWRAALVPTPPVSLPAAYRVRGLPIYQQQSLTGPLAGHLASGEVVTIDVTYPNGAGHLADSRGFVDLDGCEVTQ